MQKQIKQILDNLSILDQEKSSAIRDILSKYVCGEIELYEAYYELMDNDLIPMPQRCSMFPKQEISLEEEKNFKNYVKIKLHN